MEPRIPASFFLNASGFYATNIAFQNSAGPVGQALAIAILGDKAVFNNCRFLGRQDTIYGDLCRQYFQNCYIEGTTDFIFGPSTAVFQNCELHSYGGTALTAASTENYVTYGYVFLNCKVTAQTTAIKTDLGRPWRPYAAVAYLNCNLGSVINPAGWDDWSNTANDATARFSEYQNTSTNAVSRVPYDTLMTAAQAAAYTTLNVLSTTYATTPAIDNWNPLNIISSVPGSCIPTTTVTPPVKHLNAHPHADPVPNEDRQPDFDRLPYGYDDEDAYFDGNPYSHPHTVSFSHEDGDCFDDAHGVPDFIVYEHRFHIPSITPTLTPDSN